MNVNELIAEWEKSLKEIKKIGTQICKSGDPYAKGVTDAEVGTLEIAIRQLKEVVNGSDDGWIKFPDEDCSDSGNVWDLYNQTDNDKIEIKFDDGSTCMFLDGWHNKIATHYRVVK